MFKEGKWNGKGKFVYANGETEEGIWKDNKFIHSSEEMCQI